jgi:hypothetical protein
MTCCRNCETPLEARFCPQCGQRNVDLERPLAELLGDVVREIFDVDGRAIQTLWMLFRRPGVLTSEFLAGRRRLYSPPLRLYLVISVLFFVVATWVAGRGILLIGDQTLEADAVGQAQLFSDYVPRLMFVLLPVFALLLKAAYRQRLYFHHLVHSLHLHSAAYFVLAFILPLEQAADRIGLVMVIQSVLLAYLLANFVISLHHVYRAGWLVTFGKAIGILLVYMILIGASLQAASHFTMLAEGA